MFVWILLNRDRNVRKKESSNRIKNNMVKKNQYNNNKNKFFFQLLIGVLSNVIVLAFFYILGHFKLMVIFCIIACCIYMIYYFRQNIIANAKNLLILFGAIGFLGISVFLKIKFFTEPEAILRGNVKSQTADFHDKADVNIFPSQPDALGLATITDNRGHFVFFKLKGQEYYGIIYKLENDYIYTTEFIEFINENEEILIDCPFPFKKNKYYKITPISFENDSFEINSDARQKMDSISNFLKQNTEYYLILQGHCSSIGSCGYNLQLGGQRASEVRNTLINLGVENDRLRIVSYGERKLIDQRDEPIAHAKNRRVEVIVIHCSHIYNSNVVKADFIQHSVIQLNKRVIDKIAVDEKIFTIFLIMRYSFTNRWNVMLNKFY